MKKLYLFAALATMLAACSENDLTVNEQPSKATETIEDAVNFDVYVGRGLTRGGLNGPITTTSIQTGDHKDAGFGVFGYYTDGEPYSAITKPNFFYNQQVKYNTDSPAGWKYSPVKYWPNEFGGDAKSDQLDRLTLFAYLPFVEVDPLTGVTKPATDTELDAIADAAEKEALKKAKDPTTNIIGMTRNTATGDPFIKYSATMDPTNSVDLCYGVAAERFTSSNSGINKNDIKKGKPYIDVAKPGTDVNSKIKFDFKHATAQLKVSIDAKVVNLATGATDIEKKETRIWVRSVTFTGITQKGALNLNSDANEGPEWYDMNGSSKITTGSLTVYDGRKDDKEANDAASNETPATLNPWIVQSKQYPLNENGEITNDLTEPGVVETPCNLFDGTYTSETVIQPVFVIPTKEKMRVTIVYDVETVDKNLPYFLSDGKTPGSTIQNTIYKDIDAFGEITAGYCYTLHLHLGMRSVDFDATVTEWQDMQAPVDLPSNLQTFAATSTGGSGTVILPATAMGYNFAVSGLKANIKPYVPTPNTVATATFTQTAANGSGIAEISVTGFTANTTTKNVSYGSARIGNYDANYVDVAFIHAAAPLGLKNLAFDAGPKLTYDIDATGLANTKAIAAAGEVKVFKNGADITALCTLSDAGHEIALPDGSLNTDVYKVYMQANDAPAETATINLP